MNINKVTSIKFIGITFEDGSMEQNQTMSSPKGRLYPKRKR